MGGGQSPTKAIPASTHDKSLASLFCGLPNAASWESCPYSHHTACANMNAAAKCFIGEHLLVLEPDEEFEEQETHWCDSMQTQLNDLG